ncbi:hypothetical protein SAMN05444411_1451 [Lutibacter oricola]|uniref:Uncharacterized protein n=1 Tax=Lutibacter oricola TaxID=762486 RepID=A0A1H3HLG3_9FLAO|nr:hypothetical protein [Lutibacter oricola]SDY16220.1 hypothetical protein SAMN05444411_1451 [Lutibacter oricola]
MNRKRIILGFFILLIEIFALRYWIYEIEKPDPSISIGIILIVPILFGINLILGLVLYFLKKPFTKLFLLNSIISPLIFYIFWSLWFSDYHERNNENFKFSINDIVYELSIEKNDEYFYLCDEKNSGRVYVGKYEKKGDSLILKDSEAEMYIVDNKLLEFPEKRTEIKLIRTE